MNKAVSLALLASLVIGLVLPAAFGQNQERIKARFKVDLSGADEVPPVTTDASGDVTVMLHRNGTSLKFRLRVCGIQSVTVAHIHVGATGTTGPPVLFLFGPVGSSNAFSAERCKILALGTLTPSDLRPAGGIEDWDDFIDALLAGNTYVNVHTTAHPGGEVRVQLVADQKNDSDEP